MNGGKAPRIIIKFNYNLHSQKSEYLIIDIALKIMDYALIWKVL